MRSALGSSTNIIPRFASSIFKPKESINKNVCKDYNPPFGLSTNETPSLLILSLNSTLKENISADSNTYSNKTKTALSTLGTRISNIFRLYGNYFWPPVTPD